jgi:hypothetical protein
MRAIYAKDPAGTLPPYPLAKGMSCRRNHTAHRYRHRVTRGFSGFGGGPFYGTGYYGGGGLGLVLVIVLILVLLGKL